MFEITPAVFAAGESYQIMMPVKKQSLFWVRVGDKNYYDESNGIMRSMTEIHRARVPMTELNKYKKYTVCVKNIIDRKPYFPETEETQEKTFDFKPVKNDGFRAYHIADAHNDAKNTVDAALAYGDIDLLIMNGDIPNHSGDIAYFNTIYEIAAKVTNGNIPIVFARGNHDLRGVYAEKIADYTPNDNGNTYYTFRVGGLWGIVLDCGEDKDDSHPEYGFTVCCHQFRERQIEFLKSVVAKEEYNDPAINYKAVICHNAFTHQRPGNDTFNIEKEIYTEWSRLLREYVKPDVMICGHFHRLEFYPVGSEYDTLGQPCPVVVASLPENDNFAGAGFEFSNGEIKVLFSDANGRELGNYTIEKRK